MYTYVLHHYSTIKIIITILRYYLTLTSVIGTCRFQICFFPFICLRMTMKSGESVGHAGVVKIDRISCDFFLSSERSPWLDDIRGSTIHAPRRNGTTILQYIIVMTTLRLEPVKNAMTDNVHALSIAYMIVSTNRTVINWSIREAKKKKWLKINNFSMRWTTTTTQETSDSRTTEVKRLNKWNNDKLRSAVTLVQAVCCTEIYSNAT